MNALVFPAVLLAAATSLGPGPLSHAEAAELRGPASSRAPTYGTPRDPRPVDRIPGRRSLKSPVHPGSGARPVDRMPRI